MLNRLRTACKSITPITLLTPLTLVDIGAAGGIQRKWRRHRRQTRSVMFEPNPVEAARLRSAPGTVVIENGLAAEAGAYTLNVAHWMGCSSMLDADPETLAYAIVRLAEAFLYNDAVTGIRGDHERLREVQAALLGVAPEARHQRSGAPRA